MHRFAFVGDRFSHIEVIQWGADDMLDLDTLVERIGRTARNQELQGVGLIYDIGVGVPHFILRSRNRATPLFCFAASIVVCK